MTRTELKVVIGILLAIAIPAYFNLRQAEVLARDIQRKNDLKHIATALKVYAKDFSTYPASSGGKIVACGVENSRACEWGEDPIMDYINPMPEDPHSPHKGIEYLYLSNTRDFQLFAHLERKDDAEFNQAVLARNLECGTRLCNFGATSSDDIKPEDELGSVTSSPSPLPNDNQ